MIEVLSEEKEVRRVDGTVERPAGPWSENIRRFLACLGEEALPVERMLAVSGGVERYSFVEGEMVHPNRWSDEALFAMGKLTAALHRAGTGFRADASSCKPWCLREIGGDKRIWCHGDIAPWNVLTRGGMPLCLVDWEFSGPLDPMVELSRVCWLFPQLVDDDLQRLYGLPSPEKRAAQVRLICEGYGLERKRRILLTNQIIETVVCETAHEAIDAGLTPSDSGCLWSFAWRTRSLYWIWRNRALLENALC